MTQGSPLHPLGIPNGEVVDLNTLFADDDITPVPVKLGEQTWMIRRDLTGRQTARYWELVRKQQDVEALKILVVNDDDAVSLNAALEALPLGRMKVAVREIMRRAGLLDEGESAAS